MSKSDISKLLAVLEKNGIFLILGHEDPDGDCLGSQLALASWLERRGKKVYLCSIGPWKRPETSAWQGKFRSRIPEFEKDSRVVSIILDCSSWERTGYQADILPAGPSIVIDHHAGTAVYGDVSYIDSASPSTTIMIQRIIEAAGDTPTLEEAEYLFLGFCTDTGFFRHLESTSSETLEAVARIVKIGVSPSETFRKITGGRNLGSRKLLGRTLDRTELYFDGRLAITWENWRDWRELGNLRDSSMLYQLLFSISGIEAVILIREQNDGMCIISLRSVSNLDVSDIARFFGGGGHKKAAGCTMSGDRLDAIEHLLRILADRMDTR